MAKLRTDGGGGGGRPAPALELHLPNVVKVLIGVGALVAINELVPEVVPAMLLLVGAYLVLSRPDVISGLLDAGTSRLGSVYRGGSR